MHRTTVLIVDDHRVVIEGIKGALSEHPEFEIVGEALNGREAVKKARILRPNIVLMDISMPDLNGVDATMQIKGFDPDIGIIIFTMYSDEEYVVDLYEAGISAYVLKEDHMEELISAIKAVRNASTYFCGAVERIIHERMKDLEQGRSGPKDAFRDLSLREREVFQLLSEGQAIKDIARKLAISPKTVESHKYNIMEKLNAFTLTDLTRIAIKKKLLHV
jgi:DNA-binding NarL/FixJ family response regulator